MRTLLWLFVTVAASVGVAITGLAVVRFVVPIQKLEANNEVAGNYLQTLGTIYAVLLAFVVFVVWSQQNEAEKVIAREANELADVVRIVRAAGEPCRSRAMEAACAYVREVTEHEWRAMAHGSGTPEAARLIEAIWSTVEAIPTHSPREQALYSEALARFNDFNNARTDRLQSSRTRMPPTMWLLLLTGGCSTVGSMYMFGIESFLSHALMTGSMAGAVSFVLFLIGDLDNPFTGDWRVTPEPLRLAMQQMERLG